MAEEACGAGDIIMGPLVRRNLKILGKDNLSFQLLINLITVLLYS